VTPAVEDSLKALIDDPAKVIRSAGDDRYQTALDIYAKGKVAGSWGTAAIIASGANYADALAVSPYSYAEKAPIFLADPVAGLDDATTQVIKDAIASGEITQIIITGGTGSVPDAIKSQLGYSVGNRDMFTRLYGQDRYETSIAVANYTAANTALAYHKLAAATGENFPDALAGGAFAGKIGTVLLLVSDDAAGRAGIESVVGTNSAAISYGYVLGGPGTVSESLKTALEAAAARS
jgi:putative cell wall-binding protein